MSENRLDSKGAGAWLQPLPLGRPVRREQVILDACRGKRVVHVGFVDEHLFEQRIASGDWLHASIDAVASSLVGIDQAAVGVDAAESRGYEAYCADAQDPETIRALKLPPAEVIVAGEIVEHLDAPGPFLRAMLALIDADGVLVLTTPNAYRPLNTLVALTGRELIHPDHTAWHSPLTLKNLVERNGWVHVETRYYHERPSLRELSWRSPSHSAAAAIRCLAALLSVRWPWWSDGIVILCRPAASEDSA